MEGLLKDAQTALDLAAAQIDAYVALHTPLQKPCHEFNWSHMDTLIANCENFIESIRQRLSDFVLALKKTRNRHACTHRIPPELLVKVFQFDLHKHKPSIRSGPLTPSRILRTVSLSSVCSHWRRLIVETSSFWSHIPIHRSEDLVGLCLQRAQSRLLNVVAIQGTSDSDELWRGEHILRGHADKVRTLNLDAHTPERIHWAINWVSELTMPCHLQVLSVTFSGQPYGYPTLKLESLAGQLHTLSLNKVEADWMACTFTRLRVLKLSNIYRMDVSAFEHIVTSPTLQIIELTNVAILGTRPGFEPIHLPNLKTLRLCYYISWTFLYGVLNVLTPATCDVELVVHGSSLMGSSSREMGSELRYMMSRYNMQNIKVWGIGRTLSLLRNELLSPLITSLPDLIALYLEDMVLDGAEVAAIIDTVQAFPRIKTIQMRRIGVTEEDFKSMIDSCSVERVELIDCWVVEPTQGDKKFQFEPGARLREWIPEFASKVSFPME